MKHTDGEWNMIYTDTIDQPKKSILSIHSRGKVIAKVYGDVEELEEEANARLIAAAPELLQAVIELIEDFEPTKEYQREIFKRAKLAIKKATE